MSVGIQLLIAFVVGGMLGLLLGWLLGRGRGGVPDARLETDLQQRLARCEGELKQTQSEVVQTKTDLATARANQASAERLLAGQREIHDRAITETKAAQERALADLVERFRALSAEALSKMQPEFLRLAEQSFGKLQEAAKGDLAQRQESIKVLVEPLKLQLETYQKRLRDAETTQADTLGKVKEQLTALSASSQSLAAETAQFRDVLKSSQRRGRWGEETLRRVVEAAGMSPHCDFVEQSKGDEGKPDLIVRLPGARAIIVDSKVPDLDFLTVTNTAEPAKRSEWLEAHAAKLRTMIKGLAEREYPKQFPNALDHVILFLPAESLFSTALEGDPDLIVFAESRQVYLATPASFIAVLRTINFIWQQQAESDNAREIVEAAEELYSRVKTFAEHFGKIREGLDKANESYNKAVGSYDRMVRPQGDKILRLRAASAERQLPEIEPLDTSLRLPPGKE